MLVFRVHTKWMLPDAEFRLFAGSIPAYGVSEICNSENLWYYSPPIIKLNVISPTDFDAQVGDGNW